MSVSENLQRIVVLCVVAVVVIGGVYLYTTRGTKTDEPTACTADAKLCPDGSAVGRVGPDCEFAKCPGEEFASSTEPDSSRGVSNNTSTLDTITVTKPTEWSVYTNSEWKYSFEYPSNYTLSEEDNGYRAVLTPPEGFSGEAEWFSVVVVQLPELDKYDTLEETLFYQANYPDGKLAWLKDWKFYPYNEGYHISTQEIDFGRSPERQAIKVRENSKDADLGEYRSIVYVLRDPAVYRITHDLASEAKYGDILKRIEDSFTVLE